MAHTVGQKGQIVIAKEIRDQLGIQPGWLALQRLVDGHVEVYFLPPRASAVTHKGSLATHIQVSVPPGEAWDRAREAAWHDTSVEHESVEAPEC